MIVEYKYQKQFPTVKFVSMTVSVTEDHSRGDSRAMKVMTNVAVTQYRRKAEMPRRVSIASLKNRASSRANAYRYTL